MGNRSSSDITVEAYDFDEIQVGDDDDRQAMLHNSPPPSPMASLSVQAVNAAIARGVATVEPPDDQNIPDHVDEEAFAPSQYERGMEERMSFPTQLQSHFCTPRGIPPEADCFPALQHTHASFPLR